MERRERLAKSQEIVDQVARSMGRRRPIVEFIGDNTADNLVAEFGRSASVEMEQFVCGLLNGSAEMFVYAYAEPRYAPFAEACQMLARRYMLMDGMEKGDVQLKVAAEFKKIFSERYAALGPEAADDMAGRYAQQFSAWLEAQSPQAANLTIPQDGKTF